MKSLNYKIKAEKHKSIPNYVFRCKPFKFDPSGFKVENERLNERIYDAEIQTESLDRFLENPDKPITYCIAGNPDTHRASYFAAYLVNYHLSHIKQSSVIWHSIYHTYKDDSLLVTDSRPSLIVIDNIAYNSMNLKFEKARDIVHKFDVPKLIICSGEDPISFMTTKLCCPVHSIAYFSGNMMKNQIQII